MSFDVAADAYGRFMGQFSRPLAVQFVELAEPQAGQRVLDVGCGPGALTAQLVSQLGPASVSAIDPSAPFVAAIQNRYPGVCGSEQRSSCRSTTDSSTALWPSWSCTS